MELDKILPDQEKVPVEIEPEKKRNDSNAEISEDSGEDIEVKKLESLMYDQCPGRIRVIIKINHTLRKIYHQKSKDIQIPLLMTYIISWR